ncbi:hypothetical protein Cri9333_0305 [Crinalium epipsammum PCC 9333]|uniref:Lipoprotein n=2 Tax=Crinalium TaxID=241421 RepID=K9VVT4_9CYAN|nr:hypothetical protein Cri9333_0305 [Crinalium epipsammum PCC 9333]
MTIFMWKKHSFSVLISSCILLTSCSLINQKPRIGDIYMRKESDTLYEIIEVFSEKRLGRGRVLILRELSDNTSSGGSYEEAELEKYFYKKK